MDKKLVKIFFSRFSLAALLSKFRIDYSDVIVIPDITKKAKEETKKEFESLISGFRVCDGDNSGRTFK